MKNITKNQLNALKEIAALYQVEPVCEVDIDTKKDNVLTFSIEVETDRKNKVFAFENKLNKILKSADSGLSDASTKYYKRKIESIIDSSDIKGEVFSYKQAKTSMLVQRYTSNIFGCLIAIAGLYDLQLITNDLLIDLCKAAASDKEEKIIVTNKVAMSFSEAFINMLDVFELFITGTDEHGTNRKKIYDEKFTKFSELVNDISNMITNNADDGLDDPRDDNFVGFYLDSEGHWGVHNNQDTYAPEGSERYKYSDFEMGELLNVTLENQDTMFESYVLSYEYNDRNNLKRIYDTIKEIHYYISSFQRDLNIYKAMLKEKSTTIVKYFDYFVKLMFPISNVEELQDSLIDYWKTVRSDHEYQSMRYKTTHAADLDAKQEYGLKILTKAHTLDTKIENATIDNNDSVWSEKIIKYGKYVTLRHRFSDSCSEAFYFMLCLLEITGINDNDFNGSNNSLLAERLSLYVNEFLELKYS